VERKRIRWSCVLRERSVPGDLLRSGEQVEGCRGQRRHVQRLASVASGVLPVSSAGVAVERRARDEVQQRQAAQYSQRAPQTPLPGNRPPRVHTSMPFSVSAWTGENASWLLQSVNVARCKVADRKPRTAPLCPLAGVPKLLRMVACKLSRIIGRSSLVLGFGKQKNLEP
jgi:hypothetical protein